MMNIFDNNKILVGTAPSSLEAFNVVNWLDRNAPESGPHFASGVVETSPETVEVQRGFFARLFGM